MNKKITYWLLGETAGRTSVATWRWLWGLPVESRGKIARNVARESIAGLTKAVARIAAAYELAKRQYHLKADELKQAEEQAKLAIDKGNQQAARLAITKAIAIEKISPRLCDRVAQAEATMNQAQSKLKKEIEKLEAYKLEMENLETLCKINGAMAEINQISTDLNLDVARSQLKTAVSQGAAW